MHKTTDMKTPKTDPVHLGSGDCSASVVYDHATRLQIMGIICEVADVVNVSEVKRCADRVMSTMARRKKPNRLWAVEAVVLPNQPLQTAGPKS